MLGRGPKERAARCPLCTQEGQHHALVHMCWQAPRLSNAHACGHALKMALLDSEAEFHCLGASGKELKVIFHRESNRAVDLVSINENPAESVVREHLSDGDGLCGFRLA